MTMAVIFVSSLSVLFCVIKCPCVHGGKNSHLFVFTICKKLALTLEM